MKASKQSRTRIAPAESHLCQFPFADGRRCRMLRHKSHRTLCVVHAREELQIAELDRIAEELDTMTGDFSTQTEINHVLGRLFKLVASGRIPARRAENLTYLAQMLLYSQKGVRDEVISARGYFAWDKIIKDVHRNTHPGSPPASWRLPFAPRPKAHPAPPQPQAQKQPMPADSGGLASGHQGDLSPDSNRPDPVVETECN